MSCFCVISFVTLCFRKWGVIVLTHPFYGKLYAVFVCFLENALLPRWPRCRHSDLQAMPSCLLYPIPCLIFEVNSAVQPVLSNTMTGALCPCQHLALSDAVTWYDEQNTLEKTGHTHRDSYTQVCLFRFIIGVWLLDTYLSAMRNSTPWLCLCVSVRAAIMFLSTCEWEQFSGVVYITLCC